MSNLIRKGFRFLRRGLTKTEVTPVTSAARRIRVREEEASESFVLMIALMVLFFVGLIFLELVHMVWMGSWNDVIFNGIMLVVGTIVGAVWGKNS